MKHLPASAWNEDACWRRIGVMGDHSCPELAHHVHCRNCPVYAGAAQHNLQRPVDAGYRDAWARELARPEPPLAVEVAPPAPAHRVPHRSRGALLGIVNVGGRLLPAVSLARLLNVDTDGVPPPLGRHAFARLLVLALGPHRYALPVHEVHGVVRHAQDALRPPAAIVGLDPAVRLAHAMEDVLVAAQEDKVRLDAGGVDVLLGAVDVLQQLAEADGAAAPRGNRIASQPWSRHWAPCATKARRQRRRPAATTCSRWPARHACTRASCGRGSAGCSAASGTSAPPHEALDDLQDAIRATGDARLAELAQRVADRAAPLHDTLHRTIEGAEHYERQALTVSTRLADEVLALRMCSFAEGVHALPRMVRDLARGLGKDVRVEIAGADTLVDLAVLARMEGPLNQLLCNAVDHGMELPAERTAAGKPAHGTIRLEARHRGDMQPRSSMLSVGF